MTSLRENLGMFSRDGRASLTGVQTIANVVSAFDKSVVANAGRVSPSNAFTNQFVEQAHKRLKF